MKHRLCGMILITALVSAAPVLAQTGPYVVPTQQFREWWPETSAKPAVAHTRKQHKRYTRYISPPAYARRSHLPPIYIPPVR
jgi:hypothetical protein